MSRLSFKMAQPPAPPAPWCAGPVAGWAAFIAVAAMVGITACVIAGIICP